MRVSILIPCFNEERRLPATIRALSSYLGTCRRTTELVFIDDGSTDQTLAVIEQLTAGQPAMRVVRSRPNRGKGAALRQGVPHARGQCVLFMDADLSYPVDTVDLAVDAVEAGADVVVGARDLGQSSLSGAYPTLRGAGSRAFQAFVEAVFDLGIPDTQCGFKAFSRDAARMLFSHSVLDRFAFDVELLALARAWQLRVVRIPVQMTHRRGSRVRLLRDGAVALYDLARVRARLGSGAYPAARPGILHVGGVDGASR